ncbi:MAG TPA: hypothetical protein VKV34_07805 [Thermoleophilia bacterium]|jgi:hypothetical protein|nr:hypothetical protein [Thermoleophilia bacterium]
MENTTTPETGDTETEVVSSPAAQPELVEEHEELLEIEDDDEGGEETGSGLIAGAFGFTSLALALISLSGGWLANVYQQRRTLELTKTQISSLKQEYDVYSSQWHTQGLFALIFGLAALLIGAGVLTAPSLLLSGKSPAWARAAALGGVFVGFIGLLLGLLMWFDVIGGQIS